MPFERPSPRPQLSGVLAVALVLGFALPAGLTSAPAVAASASFSESFRGTELAEETQWIATKGDDGVGPGNVTHASEPACLTGLAVGESITLGGGTSIVGCPHGVVGPRATETRTGTGSLDQAGAGVLRLTDDRYMQSTAVLNAVGRQMSDGLDITFSFAMYCDRGDDCKGGATHGGANGFSFFIKDAANTNDAPGGTGAALGYALRTGTMPNNGPGVRGGLLAVGFDFFGAFSAHLPDGALAKDCPGGATVIASAGDGFAGARDRVVLRGPDLSTSDPQDGSCGYEYLDRSAQDATLFGRSGDHPATSRAAATRHARIVIDKPASATPRVKVWVWAGPSQPDDDEYVLDVPQPAALRYVDEFKFGFGAATGWATNVHEVWDLSIVLADPVVQAVQFAAAEEAAAAERNAAAAQRAAGPSRTGLSLVCSPEIVQPGRDVTCTVTSGPFDADILWRASIADRPVDSRGVSLDADGSGTFVFRAPSDVAGATIDVELVDWGVDTSVVVSGGPIPTRVDAGSGGIGVDAFVLLVAGVVALLGFGVRRQARHR